MADEIKNEKATEPEFIEDLPLPDLVEQYQLGKNIRDENGNIIYNSDVIKYLQSIFGDGSDGDVTITGDTNLITDMFYDNLTIASPFTLYGSGYRIFVKNKLTINVGAKIARNGNDGGDGQDGDIITGGAGGLPGAALSSGSLYGALAGKIGGDGGGFGEATDPGVNGDDLAKCLGSNAVGGGAGGAGQGGAGGSASSGGSKTGTVYNYPRGLVPAYMLYDTLPAGDILKSNPSAGSGGGGGMGANATRGRGGGGGGSASGAGIVEIFAKNIVLNGTIETKGGKGGDGGNGNSVGGDTWYGGGGGGGGSGNGGIILLVYISKTGTGTTDVSGGLKGNKGLKGGAGALDGDDGTAGVAGLTINLKI